MLKAIIAAIADNGAIGRNNSLMWHIAEDMKYFRSITIGSPVIMGRKTYESIGRPLPKRLNIIVSRKAESIPGVEIVRNLDEAFKLAESSLQTAIDGESSSMEHQKNVPQIMSEADAKCFIIGGGEIYSQALPYADRLYITRVHCPAPEADTFFPVIDGEIWEVTGSSESKTDPESGLRYEFVVYNRKS